MKNKIFWLSILGLALARPPNPIDSTASDFDDQQKQRISRSIWPFTSSVTTTEAPENYPPPLPDNTEWFVKGETPLPQGIDLNKYPVWKIHKYNGIDLHPVKLQPENTYSPELHHVIDSGYSSGSSLSSDFPQYTYQNGYQDVGTYPSGYSAAHSSSQSAYPDEQESYQTGEFHSSSFTPDTNSYHIQTQQKHEVYALPQPFKDFRSTGGSIVSELQQNPTAPYGPPNTYHTGSVDYQGHNQERQRQVFGAGKGQIQSTDGNNPDLSFLDDLGGLAPFLPEPTDNKESAREESEAQQQGFFEKLFSRFRGQTEAPANDVAVSENDQSATSGGFLSSVFGVRTDTQLPEIESPATESSGSAFSSLFYQPETERPAVVLPTTYYLPKTRGSYIAVKLPTNAPSSFPPSVGPYDDVSNIAFYEAPKVPFTQREIPQITGPTLDSGYPYNLGYSEVRNSGFSGSAISTDYQPSVAYSHPRPPNSKIPTPFQQNHGNYELADHGVENFASHQGDTLDLPHVEFLHSANNDQQSGVPNLSNQLSSGTKYYQRQQNFQDSRISGMHQTPSTVVMPQSVDPLPTSYLNGITSSNADEQNLSQNENRNQNLNSQEYQYQNFDTSNSNSQGLPYAKDTSEHNVESFLLGQTVNENESNSGSQFSGGFIPSLGYDVAKEVDDQLNFNTNNHENGQQTTSTHEGVTYDHSRDIIGDGLVQNFDVSSVLNPEPLPLENSEPSENPVSFHQTPISSLQDLSNTQEKEDYSFLPIKEAYNFQDTFSNQEDDDTRFIKNLSALTSYGTPTNSYESNAFVTGSSNMRSVVVPAPAKEEVSDGVYINMNKDVFRPTPSEQSPSKKVGRVVRKVMKRRNSVENDHAQRSAPERQAPIEEADTSLVIRSEKDSIPEVRGSRQFDGTQVFDGYSKVQNQQHQFLADNTRATKPVNLVLEAVHQYSEHIPEN